MMKSLTGLAILTIALQAPVAYAQSTDDVIRELREQIAVLSEKVTELEKKSAGQAAVPSETAVQATVADESTKPAARESWTDKVSLQGDLRVRYENIDEEGLDERNRNRFRARLGVTAKPQDNLEVGFGLSTSQDGDPVSSNQTIGDGGSRKDVYVDLAYFDWKPVGGLSVMGGKFRNPLYRPGKHALLWDSDWNPEGLGVVYRNGMFFGNAIGTWLDGDSSGESAELVVGGQVGMTVPLAEEVKLTAGVGYYDFSVAGRGTFYGGDNAFGGNGFDPATLTYLNDYEELEAFAELAFRVLGLPATVFVDYVNNRAADDFDTGWAAGVTLGQVKSRGSWELSWVYQDLEADAVIALLTDADFGGGGTGNSGHVLRGTYALGDRWNVATSYFINDIEEDSGTKTGYDRFQLDLNFRY